MGKNSTHSSRRRKVAYLHNVQDAGKIKYLALALRRCRAEKIFLRPLGPWAKSRGHVSDHSVIVNDLDKHNSFPPGLHVGYVHNNRESNLHYLMLVRSDNTYITYDANGLVSQQSPNLCHDEQSKLDHDHDGVESFILLLLEHVQATLVVTHEKFKTLNSYPAWSGKEYGELLPSLLYRIFDLAQLSEGSIFLDLGCGVGNAVAQASIQCVCKSFGVDIQPNPIKIANHLLQKLAIRCKLAEIPCGAMEVECEDMETSAMVEQVLPDADLVLFNNRSFSDLLIQSFCNTMLPQMKKDAVVVSIKPLCLMAADRRVPKNAVKNRKKEWCVNSMTIVLETTLFEWVPGEVSWTEGRGEFFFYRICEKRGL